MFVLCYIVPTENRKKGGLVREEIEAHSWFSAKYRATKYLQSLAPEIRTHGGWTRTATGEWRRHYWDNYFRYTAYLKKYEKEIINATRKTTR